MKSNRDYATENINLKQQIIDLKVANKDKAETIKAVKQELLEYNQLRDRFKVLYEENEKLKTVIDVLKKYLFLADEKSLVWQKGYEHSTSVSDDDYNLLKEVLE